MKINNYILRTEKNISDKTITMGVDLHISKKTKQTKLQEILDSFDKTNPTHIVIPGDLYNVDYETVYGDDTKVADFLNTATEIAPVYYVPGNSELKADILPENLTYNNNPNLHILCDTSEKFIEYGEKTHQYTDSAIDDDITISAIKLPLEYYDMYEFQKSRFLLDPITLGKFAMSNFSTDENKLNILLCHDPYIITIARYLTKKFDLVLSGHNHGGLFSEDLKPLLKILKADLDKLYPTYINGFRQRLDTHYLISEGITKYHSEMGPLQYLEKYHEGTIDVVRCRKR